MKARALDRKPKVVLTIQMHSCPDDKGLCISIHYNKLEEAGLEMIKLAKKQTRRAFNIVIEEKLKELALIEEDRQIKARSIKVNPRG